MEVYRRAPGPPYCPILTLHMCGTHSLIPKLICPALIPNSTGIHSTR